MIARLSNWKFNHRTAMRANQLSFRHFHRTPRNPLKSNPLFRTNSTRRFYGAGVSPWRRITSAKAAGFGGPPAAAAMTAAASRK